MGNKKQCSWQQGPPSACGRRPQESARRPVNNLVAFLGLPTDESLQAAAYLPIWNTYNIYQQTNSAQFEMLPPYYTVPPVDNKTNKHCFSVIQPYLFCVSDFSLPTCQILFSCSKKSTDSSFQNLKKGKKPKFRVKHKAPPRFRRCLRRCKGGAFGAQGGTKIILI